MQTLFACTSGSSLLWKLRGLLRVRLVGLSLTNLQAKDMSAGRTIPVFLLWRTCLSRQEQPKASGTTTMNSSGERWSMESIHLKISDDFYFKTYYLTIRVIKKLCINIIYFFIYKKKLNNPNGQLRSIKVKNVIYFGTESICQSRQCKLG